MVCLKFEDMDPAELVHVHVMGYTECPSEITPRPGSISSLPLVVGVPVSKPRAPLSGLIPHCGPARFHTEAKLLLAFPRAITEWAIQRNQERRIMRTITEIKVVLTCAKKCHHWHTFLPAGSKVHCC
jgi:hypothetical protein